MLIILDRGDRPSIPQYGLGPARDMHDAMTFAEYTFRQTQRIIEDLGVPAEMYRNATMYRSVTTGRSSSSIPNISQGSVRHLHGG